MTEPEMTELSYLLSLPHLRAEAGWDSYRPWTIMNAAMWPIWFSWGHYDKRKYTQRYLLICTDVAYGERTSLCCGVINNLSECQDSQKCCWSVVLTHRAWVTSAVCPSDYQRAREEFIGFPSVDIVITTNSSLTPQGCGSKGYDCYLL